MKKNRNKIDWKISDEKICWAVVIMILAMMIVILSSCKTHKESVVDYELTSTETYQERRAEEHERQMAVSTAESRDTVREMSKQTGQIEIERDTAGRAVKIIYEHVFTGLQTQGSSRVDTVYQQQVIVLRDSVGNGQKDTTIEGRAKEKNDVGFTLTGMALLSFIVCVGLIVLFILVKKWKG